MQNIPLDTGVEPRCCSSGGGGAEIPALLYQAWQRQGEVPVLTSERSGQNSCPEGIQFAGDIDIVVEHERMLILQNNRGLLCPITLEVRPDRLL